MDSFYEDEFGYNVLIDSLPRIKDIGGILTPPEQPKIDTNI